MYKTSMFNYKTYIDGDLVIYNSLNGTKSICKVQDSKKDKIIKWLESNNPFYISDDNDFDILVEYGYLIDSRKNVRNALYAQYMFDEVLNLVIHTTKQCNFRCQYCYLDFKSEPMLVDIQESVISFINKNLHKYNCVKISWFGGEPLLQMDVIKNISEKVMNLCKRAKNHIILL